MVQKLWPGETVVILASGPSLTQADVDYVRGQARVIAINDCYRMAPWADCLYACDVRWWTWQYELRPDQIGSFAGLRFGMKTIVGRWQPEWNVTLLKNAGTTGLELNPGGLKTGATPVFNANGVIRNTGGNSGYQAINLAVHLGAVRIVLLGYDMSLGHGGKTHWHGDHPNGKAPKLTKFRLNFHTIAPPLKELGIEVLNCSRRSALTCFPKVALERALPQRKAAA